MEHYVVLPRPDRQDGTFQDFSNAGNHAVLLHYFVRIGSLGEIRLAGALAPLHRGQRVVVRTPRGIEVASVASQSRQAETLSRTPSGNDITRFRVIRPVSETDEMLLQRLEQYKADAITACRTRLKTLQSKAILLDVDQLLDGGTLVMHFLGELDEKGQQIVDEVSREYETVVRSDELARLMDEGCGPECGTGTGCGSSHRCAGCSGCD